MATSPTSAVAFVLQATPWVPLVIRRGSSSEVSVQIPLSDENQDIHDEATNRLSNTVDEAHGANDCCLVWQFRVEEYDVAFQIIGDGQALQELARYSAEGGRLNHDTHASSPAGNATHPDAVSAEGMVPAATRGCIYTFRWDNSYSIVRHKRVFYRFVVTSYRAVRAAQTAALEVQERRTQPKNDESHPKPHLAKRLALERRLTVDEVSLEQTRAIEQLHRCVTDMVAMFMTDPDRPLHEGSIREFLLSLEAVLRNGIKEKYLSAWPEEPYYEFLLQIKNVLRDDKHLVTDVKMLPPITKLHYLGWTRSRSLLMLALNRNMLHSAFENLIKRRSVVESYYDNHALLFMYSSATQIASFLSALNGVKFLLAVTPKEAYLASVELPPNLMQCSPEDAVRGEAFPMKFGGRGYVIRTNETEDPDDMKKIEHCSVIRNLLIGSSLDEVTIGRGQTSSIEIHRASHTGFCLAIQICVVPGDILISIQTTHDGQPDEHLTEPLIVSPSNGWTELVLIFQANSADSIMISFDNSNALVRARQVAYRIRSASLAQYDTAWESAQGIAQSISWKIATWAGVERCREHMQGLFLQDEHFTAEQQHRHREASGSYDNGDGDQRLEDDGLFGMGASFISKPVSYLVSGFINLDGDSTPPSCTQCLSPFSFFSRHCICPSCKSVVCAPCSRHTAQLRGQGPHVKVCDRCFIMEKDEEKRRLAAIESGRVATRECAEYAALREDPSMEKYFKMLSFGVPHSGVAQKMLQDEMPSDKIVVFSAGPAGEVDEPTANVNKNQAIVKHPSRKQYHGKLFRKVHWKSLESKRAVVSIWNKETSRRKTAPIRLSPQDYQDVARLFCREKTINGGDASSMNPGGSKKKPVFNALDSRRSNNISIGLSQFKAVGGAKAILKSVWSCDFNFLTADRLSSINDIAPTSVEAKRYSNFRGNRSRLDPAETFLVEMCEIPRVTEKIAAMRFIAHFESQHRELQRRTQAITAACYQILRSERLARFFELILTIGNLLNTGTEIENAGGVTLESLLKLSETKSIDQMTTLLHFIVRLIHDRGEGDILLFIQELNMISEAKRYSNLICQSQANTFRSGVAQAEQEIREEMILDLRRFEKEENEVRRHRQTASTSSQEISKEDGSSRGVASEQQPNPHKALMQMIRNRAEQNPISKPPYAPISSLTEQNASDGVTTAAASMRKRTGNPVESACTVLAPRHEAELSSTGGQSISSTTVEFKPRAALMDAIRMKMQGRLGETSGDESPMSAQSSVQSTARANLLSAIRSHGTRGEENESNPQQLLSTCSYSSKKSIVFTPQVYSAENNAFIRVMRIKLLEIKTAMEQLEAELETMLSAWDTTARYLGEDPMLSSSEYVLQLLNRFILDVKIVKSVFSRQGLSFQSPSIGAQVGSVVATKFGPGIVTAIRGETKFEVLFPWSREAYLSPSMILSVGAVVRCKKIGVGIIRSAQYDYGFCSVRFNFGIGSIRVQDISPVACSNTSVLKRDILAGGILVGDLVTTPFGCGCVRSIQTGEKQNFIRQRRPTKGYAIVDIMSDTGSSHRATSVAYVQLQELKMNY